MTDLGDKVALVTGGGRRVGRVLALALAEKGAAVAVHYNESSDGAREVVATVANRKGSAEVFGADLTQPDAPPKLIERVIKRFGRIDVLVNSAANMVRTPFGAIDVAQWDHVFALNLRAPFFLAQAAAEHLRRTQGVIINIADLAAFETWPAYIPHGQTKAGIVYLTKALARVLAPDVRVNAIAPGTVLLPEGMSDADAEHLRETTLLKRHGTPEDVASAMLFLVAATYITGQTVIVDGGRLNRRA